MPVNWKALSIEERDEFRSLMSEALDGSRQPDISAVARAMDAMEAADRAGRAWPDEVRRQAIHQLLQSELKRIAKEESMVSVDYNGRFVQKTARRGVVKRQIDGTTYRQQSLWTDMTWEEFEGWSAMNDAQIDGLMVNRHAAAKLRTLHERFPESRTVGEALAAIGATLEEFLGAESA